MQLNELLDYTLGAIINTMCYVIIMKKVFSAKLNSNKFKIYIPMVIGSFVIAIMNIQNKDMFKPLFTIPIMALTTGLMTSQKFSRALVTTIGSMLYLFLSEILVAVLASCFNIQEYVSLNGIFGSTRGNIIVAILTIPFLYINPLKKFLNKLIQYLNKESSFGILILILLFAGALLSKNATHIDNLIVIITNFFLTLIFIVILFLLLNEYQKKEQISYNYNALFSYLKVYENELVEKRKIIHDYNNQLIIIKGYINEKNEVLKSYVNSIIKEQSQIANNLMINLDNIPKGLKGLICYKLSTLDSQIKPEVFIDKNAKNIIIPEPVAKDYLKIAGVFLDNAIEACIKSKEKQLSIIIEVKEKIMKLEIKNSYEGIITAADIYTCGYSTKGSKRGYGLSLVKDIVNKNSKIKIATKITKNKFVAIQKISID